MDLLGAKAHWKRDGRAGAERAFERLGELVVGGAKGLREDELVDGLLETDSSAIVCTSVDACIRSGIEIFRSAFSMTGSASEDRLWLRGTITKLPRYAGLRSLSSVPTPLRKIKVSTLAPGLLDALSVEKSGFKGMRLLIEAALMNKPLLDRFAIPVGARFIAPFKTLKHSYYPTRLGRKYEDVFWMISDAAGEWEQAKRTMALRLRLAARDQEEFIQAAATQVVFHECSAILGNLRRDREARLGEPA